MTPEIIASIIGTLVTALATIIVALIQNRTKNEKNTPQNLLVPQGYKVHSPQTPKKWLFLIPIALLGGLVSYFSYSWVIDSLTPQTTPALLQGTAKVIPLEGEISEVPISSLESNNCAGGGGYPGLVFQGGKRIPFSEMKSFDISTAFETEYTYTITVIMLNNEEFTENLSANYIGCYLTGSLANQGELKIFIKDVRRVELED